MKRIFEISLILLISFGCGHKIGETYQGGIIFSIDNSGGKHGLLAAPIDQSDSANWEDAKRLCSEYRGGGFSDWRLPTLEELKQMYKNISAIDSLDTSGVYWSSTEDEHSRFNGNAINAMGKSFEMVYESNITAPKFNLNRARAVRDF
jgi:Protein of unknown function (DUF1566)